MGTRDHVDLGSGGRSLHICHAVARGLASLQRPQEAQLEIKEQLDGLGRKPVPHRSWRPRPGHTEATANLLG